MAQVKIQLTAFSNCDDVQLFWRPNVNGQMDVAIPGCLGFSIERQRLDKDGNFKLTEILRNRVGFKTNEPGNLEDAEYITQPSTVWPFQTYNWTDHGATNDETVKYRIVAMGNTNNAKLGQDALSTIATSDWTAPIKVTDSCGNDICAFFNRGFVMSQFVSRIARENNWTARDIKANIKMLQEPLRRFLSGELRNGILKLLNEAISDPQIEFYAALYELTEGELINQLKLLRQRAHIVLANGSDKQGDGNEDAREALKAVKVDVRDRLLGSKGLGHNKFVVLYHKKYKKALKVWTGSMNWAATGMCTQVNNAILISDSVVAGYYLKHWNDLANAEDGFPKELIDENAKSPYIQNNIESWFTPVRRPSKKNEGLGIDLQQLVDLVNGAQQMVLYVMFQPGAEPLQTIMALDRSRIIVKGVVSTLQSDLAEEVYKLDGSFSGQFSTRLIVPDGIPINFAFWLKEVTRSEFLFPFQNPGIGHAITHSKMIVIDPLSDNCKVITGSHNFSISASEKNDDNFVVITGNKKLAAAYSVAALGTYAHYRWRAYVSDKLSKKEAIWSHLSGDPAWQTECLTDEVISTLNYWCS